jgi:predicted nucleic acid-binding protein
MIVLDAWALLAYLRGEPCAERVEVGWISSGAAICALNLGEALCIRMRERGPGAAHSEVEVIARRAEIVEADWPLVREAAEIKAAGGPSFADAFCLATALRLRAPLWTGDPEILLAATDRCEVVDLRAA